MHLFFKIFYIQFFIIFFAVVSTQAFSFGCGCQKDKVYVNDKFEFSLSYPRNLVPSAKFTERYNLNTQWSAVSETPSTSQGNQQDEQYKIVQIPIVEYQPKGKPYYFLVVRVGASANPTDLKNCYPVDKYRVINGNKFCEYKFSDAAMSKIIDVISYRIRHNGFCYAVEIVSAKSDPGAYANSNSEYKAMKKQLDRVSARSKKIARKIINSFRFLKKQ